MTASVRATGAATARGWSLRRGRPGYPGSLEDLDQPPGLLHGLGDRDVVAGLDRQATVAIVGSRRATTYGTEVATGMARLLAGAGLTIVSGMAHGIDAAAHRGALDAGGPTVAVLGGGPDVVYPPGQRRLYQRILEHGAIVSEQPPGERPAKWMFPTRNRIMAALAGATVVVETAERSGSLITAQRAIEIQREVGAVPGPVTSRSSAGANRLIKDGAQLVRDAQDVIDLLLYVGATGLRPPGPELEAALAAALEAVEAGRSTADGVALAAGLAASEAAVALVRLELLGYASSDATGRYARTALARPTIDE